MTTYNITSNLLNTTSRNLWVIARNSSSAPAPAWLVWTALVLCGLVVLATASYILWSCKDDIEYYFWSKKYRKK